jgi:hypothetical protein
VSGCYSIGRVEKEIQIRSLFVVWSGDGNDEEWLANDDGGKVRVNVKK